MRRFRGISNEFQSFSTKFNDLHRILSFLLYEAASDLAASKVEQKVAAEVAKAKAEASAVVFPFRFSSFCPLFSYSFSFFFVLF